MDIPIGRVSLDNVCERIDTLIYVHHVEQQKNLSIHVH